MNHKVVTGSWVRLGQEDYLKIAHVDAMRPFFMSIVSDANHWMFISSNGGLTAGRKNAEFALFPYYTDDLIADMAEVTGCKSVFQVRLADRVAIWEPFSIRNADQYHRERNLYKNRLCNKILFEEINHDLGLCFRYQWNSSNLYGFVRKAEFLNLSDQTRHIRLLDGLQNILPYGVSSDLQRASSNLVDAYKRCELEPDSGIGIFALSAIIVDKAEPSEALKANVAWSAGLDSPTYLLSSLQLDRFRRGHEVMAEKDIKGEKGAYFVSSQLTLEPLASKCWKIIANLNQSQSDVVRLSAQIVGNREALEQEVETDIQRGSKNLLVWVAAADGLQYTADKLKDTRHYSNVLFNIMRGGIFDRNYAIDKRDLIGFVQNANSEVAERHIALLRELGDEVSCVELLRHATLSDDPDLIRLSTEYLPLTFSRRHGDPSRPWNKFSINTQSEEDGSRILDYQGNWRDIFQNWEALAYSFPEFLEGMIFKFLNASTFDGYNPYRVTKSGFDWETIEPDDPWSYIGYWGDHQIIYLLKLFEALEKHKPQRLNALLDKEHFVYAAVPYKIKPYEQTLQNPKDTIVYDHKWNADIQRRRDVLGADGALLYTSSEGLYHVNLIEKILATTLAKMANFVPEGGIWMNTQRPEWNDANNALVGNGVSMVTLYYLRRFFRFLQDVLARSSLEKIKISGELIEFYHSVRDTLQAFKPLLAKGVNNHNRKDLMDRLGKAASEYRQQIYHNGFWGKKRSISLAGLKTYAQLFLEYIDHSIGANRRTDGLYHAYNLIDITDSEVALTRLDEMLEGQVAVLSSGYLNASQALEVLTALKQSALFREDQNSYILYPNKSLPGFLQKNNIPASAVASSRLLQKMIEDGNTQIVERDERGVCHFNGNFKNAADLEQALERLSHGHYATWAAEERTQILQIFENVFNHKAFTGRSGTFFAYEGLGSIYWHMVSKLLLATQECALKALQTGADAALCHNLIERYYDIREGIGVHKSPDVYGAFPTDPYSHTPMHRGAQQPGMTGQVKEDILARWGELGVGVEHGCLSFKPTLLKKDEFATAERQVVYVDVTKEWREIPLAKDQLFFTYCQIPVIYALSDTEQIEIFFTNGDTSRIRSLDLDARLSAKIFERTHEIRMLKVSLTEQRLL